MPILDAVHNQFISAYLLIAIMFEPILLTNLGVYLSLLNKIN